MTKLGPKMYQTRVALTDKTNIVNMNSGKVKSNRTEKQTYDDQEASNSVIKKSKRIKFKSYICNGTVYQNENKKSTVKTNSKISFKNKEIPSEIPQVPSKSKTLQKSANTATKLNIESLPKKNGIKTNSGKENCHGKEQEKERNVTNDATHFKGTSNLKKMIVKIPQLEDKYHHKCKISSKDYNSASKKDDLLKEKVCKCSIIPKSVCNKKINENLQNDVKTNDKAIILPANKHTSRKELTVKLTNILNTSETSEQNKNKQISLKTSNSNETSEKCVNNVNKKEKATDIYNLRHLQPKIYLEDSTINTSDSLLGCRNKIDNVNTKQKNEIPIYQQVSPEKQKVNKEVDLYEFVDTSPKKKCSKPNGRKSSILFDKNTHDILKKIEQKEAKAMKKKTRKKTVGLKCAIPPKKSYKDIINTVVSDIKKKIKNNVAIPPIAQANKGNQELSDTISGGHNNEVLKNNFEKVTHLNDFSHENIIAVHSNKTTISQQSNCLKTSTNMDNASKHSGLKTGDNNNRLIIHSNIVVSNKEVPNIILSTHTDDAMQAETSAISIQNDVECSFGFEDDEGQNDHCVKSPLDFNIRRPNANSTMINFRTINETSSPWRPNRRNVKENPHFLSIKRNGLPRIDQDPVLDHTLVEEFESHSCNTSKNLSVKKLPIQQSILDFVEGHVENRNDYREQNNIECELFNSPTKNTKKKKEHVSFRRNLLENKGNIISSTPIKRKVLQDISNSSEEQVFGKDSTENDTLFGIDNINRSSVVEIEMSSQWNLGSEQHNDHQICSEDSENRPKPSRFDLTVIKSYLVKDRKKNKVQFTDKVVPPTPPNKSISLVQTSNADQPDSDIHEDIHLFEEPEEILDSMSPPHLPKKNHRRKRLDSCDSSDELRNGELRRKRHKKTKFEIEQEEWINNFNQQCEEIDRDELELE